MTGPLPSPDLTLREPELVEIPKGTIIHRFYTASYDPIFFDKSVLGRFNAPDGSFGVLYAADTQSVAVPTASTAVSPTASKPAPAKPIIRTGKPGTLEAATTTQASAPRARATASRIANIPLIAIP